MRSTGSVVLWPVRFWRRGGPLVAAALVGALLLSSCADGQGSADDEGNPPDPGSEETMTSESETTDEASDSGRGLIDVEGGYTQDEQMAELETVVEVMREHFGEEVATIGDEPWTAERHNAEVPASPRGDDVYRHSIQFDVSPEDLEETYAAAEEIAEQLGLSENSNNSHGITEYGEIFYGAGREEGRTFVMTGESADSFAAEYLTRHSEHESIISAYESITEENRQEFRDQYRSDTPD